METKTRREMKYFGTDTANDEPSYTFNQRVQRCYELATYAVVFGTAPEGSILNHGSWYGGLGYRRIGHAWVVLPDGRVWEPITCEVFETEEAWVAYSNAEIEAEYTKHEAEIQIMFSGHYGRWHDSDYP